MKAPFFLLLLLTLLTASGWAQSDTMVVDSISKIGKEAYFKEDYLKFLGKNLRYPYDAMDKEIQGKVHLRFIVEKDGSISDLKIVKGVYPSLDEETLRVVSLTNGKWSPGTVNEQAIRSYKNLSLEYKISIEEDQSRKRKRKK